ncbi:MAG: Shedu anti-phage system protein SduA domain-containing protein [Anaerolineae bacterium]
MQLGNFTVKYHAALEAALERFGRSRFPLYGDRVEIIHICKASDGYVTFYLPEQPEMPDDIPRGCMGVDYSDYDLNTLCQAMHSGLLRVGDPNIGRPASEFPLIPPDAPRPAEITGTWFSTTVRNAARDGQLFGLPLPAVMVVPVVDVRAGVRTAVSPSRIKLWSPTVDIPGRGRIRLYDWTHADFWWMPEQLPLDHANAEELAYNDLMALVTVLGASGPITPASAGQDMSERAATVLEEACNEFLRLLAVSGDDEETIHQWLNRPEHHLFIDPQPVEVRSKMPFGSKVSDFVVRRPNNTYVLVEIERATRRIFQERGQEPTAEFNRACQQVRDWQRYIRDNVHTVRIEQKLDGIDQPRGVLIIGRTADITGEEALMRWRDMKNTHEMDVATYDDVCDRVRSLAASLRCMLRRSSSAADMSGTSDCLFFCLTNRCS